MVQKQGTDAKPSQGTAADSSNTTVSQESEPKLDFVDQDPGKYTGHDNQKIVRKEEGPEEKCSKKPGITETDKSAKSNPAGAKSENVQGNTSGCQQQKKLQQ